MTGTAKAGTAGQRRAVFAVDEDAALAALGVAWADGGYHGFSADDGTWSAISSAGTCSPATPRRTGRKIRAHWQAGSEEGRPVNRAYGGRSLGPLPRGDVVQDCVERRRRFEAEQPGVTIVTPAGRRTGGGRSSRWACFPMTARPSARGRCAT